MFNSKSSYLIEMKNNIFMAVMVISVFVFVVTSIVNLMNRRPLANLLVPLASAGLILFLYRLYLQQRHRVLIKTFYLAFLCFVFLPVGWLTSPGSYSAMSFYAVVILFVSLIVANEWWEYLFPLGVTLITILLLNFEPTRPDQFTLYTDPQLRALDLSVNFLVAGGTMLVVLMVMNRSFKHEHRKVFDSSITDPLTGIFNRRYLYHILETMTNGTKSENSQFTLLMMDLNNFKKINDTFGHTEGDRVLKEFASVLQQSSRKNDVPIRYGGDEFVLLLNGSDEADASRVEQRILNLFKPICSRYPEVPLAVSFGKASGHSGNADEIIKTADDLLYKSKGKKLLSSDAE